MLNALNCGIKFSIIIKYCGGALKQFLILLFLVFGFGICVNAQAPIGSVINEVLFSISGESATSYDRKIYKSVLKEIFQKDKISQFTENPQDDFLLSRLSYKEAQIFGVQPVEIKVNELSRKKNNEFSQNEIAQEAEIISKALALIKIKETQLKQKERFDIWFELIKRKYQVKIKSLETK